MVEPVVVDVLVGDEADGVGVDGADEHTLVGECSDQVGWERARLRADDVGAHGRGIEAPGERVGDGDGEAAEARVVVGEAFDHRLEGDDARRRDHAGLAHLTTEPRPVNAGDSEVLAGPAQHGAHRCAETFRETEHHRVARSHQLRRRHIQRDGRVPDARAVAVHREAARVRDGGDLVDLGRGRGSAARRHVRVLEEQRAELGQVVRGSREGVLDVGCVQQAVGVGQRAQLHTRVHRGGGVLVAQHVGALTAQHLGARHTECAQRELVGHRARRHVQRGVLAEQRGGQRLQPPDGRVLAVAVVADLGVGHRRAHLRRGRGDGVGAEVDPRHAALQRFARTGRTSPSCATLAASVPSAQNT